MHELNITEIDLGTGLEMAVAGADMSVGAGAKA
jgi:hypothetical protein